jgi:hypothetical protein
LGDSYEELRAFALSNIKTQSQPLGLDLWLRKGFLSWSMILLYKNSLAEPIRRTSERVKSIDDTTALVQSISNMLIEWEDKNVELFSWQN